jgi:hypothetical protein
MTQSEATNEIIDAAAELPQPLDEIRALKIHARDLAARLDTITNYAESIRPNCITELNRVRIIRFSKGEKS